MLSEKTLFTYTVWRDPLFWNEHTRSISFVQNNKNKTYKHTHLHQSELAGEFKRCAAVDRIPLNFLEGNAFKERADTYLRERLRRGVPSLFRDMSALYANPDKVKIISELLEGYLTCLRAESKFASDSVEESPASLIWTCYYAGHHHDHLGNLFLVLATACSPPNNINTK